MPIATQKITPCLWFDTQAEEAANACLHLQGLQNREHRGLRFKLNEGRIFPDTL